MYVLHNNISPDWWGECKQDSKGKWSMRGTQLTQARNGYVLVTSVGGKPVFCQLQNNAPSVWTLISKGDLKGFAVKFETFKYGVKIQDAVCRLENGKMQSYEHERYLRKYGLACLTVWELIRRGCIKA